MSLPVWAFWPGYMGAQVDKTIDEAAQPRTAVAISPRYVAYPDEEVGGTTGLVNHMPYSIGPVETGMVENFELTGRTVRMRRPVEKNDGPVKGGRDHMAGLGVVVAQQGWNASPPDYVYQTGIIGAV